ncbi:helix-turn-helix domain-containing protein [Mesorhizobium sp. ORM8.1]
MADESSFARAAEEANVSQPALSQTIIQYGGRLAFRCSSTPPAARP